jgi:hypothetical protein
MRPAVMGIAALNPSYTTPALARIA